MSILYEHQLCHRKNLINSISSGSSFHLPNKPGQDFKKCLKHFSPTYLWLLSRIKMFSKSPGDFKLYGLKCISVCFCFLHTWFNSYSEFQSWTVNPVAFITQDQRQYTEAKTSGLIWRCVCNTCYKLGSLFPGLWDYSSLHMWTFLLKHSSEPSLCGLSKNLWDIWHAQVSVQSEIIELLKTQTKSGLVAC